ncbi:prephenate dehydrogenase [Macrolepiota fuliginosa MF-IS2]|uniref:Prephenate dehydrogenase n=1 Tax=Macrolepiota fuliginosa MF-IS2 TaxID=1400762 RepID=A0A9P5XP61_9AGAR|nr:prephenate dehydrogenase [Macrolepiota fuliginosa MF-IS2]
MSPYTSGVSTSRELFTLPINVDPNVTPDAPEHAQPVIGLVGMGAMGRMYAKLFSEAGWKKIYVCDLPEKYEQLKVDYANTPGVYAQKDGYAVSRSSDYIIYSVEAEFTDRVVAQYGPSTKVNAIVAGQTSVKAPERAAFDAHLPKDVHILSCHSLHGPTVSPAGQPLVLIQHRSSKDALTLVENILRPFGSRFVYLSYEEHDSVTANTQAVTHAAFLSMGTAWASASSYPWEQGLYVGGIETAKVNLALRIYSNAWHVYAGLAILNPVAGKQIDQYAKSASELFKLMLSGGSGSLEDRKKFTERVEWARKIVFGEWSRNVILEEDTDGTVPFAPSSLSSESDLDSPARRQPILLSASILDRFSLGKSNYSKIVVPPSPILGTTEFPLPSSTLAPPQTYRPNSHLSLLAMVDSWAHLGINPYTHLQLAATPLFRLFLGVAEHLFQSPTLLKSSIHSAIYDYWHRGDDLEFVIAARGWSQTVSFGSFEVYRRRFDETRRFFEPRFEEAGRLGSQMIKAVMESEVRREREEEKNLRGGIRV